MFLCLLDAKEIFNAAVWNFHLHLFRSKTVGYFGDLNLGEQAQWKTQGVVYSSL